MKKLLALVMILMLATVGFSAFAEGETLTIAGLVHCENQWADMLMAGMAAACEEFGIDFVYSNYNQDAVREVELINTYVTQGVAGIIASPSQSSIGAYREAFEAGIPVAFVNAAIDNNDFSVTHVLYSNYDLGMAAAKCAVDFVRDNLDGKPVWHALYYKRGEDVENRINAFSDAFREAFGEEYAEPVSNSATTEESVAMQQVTDALTANPDINVLAISNENQYYGARAAIQSMGLEGKVFCFAVDCSESMCENMLDEEDPILQGDGAQNSYAMGYEGCKALCDHIVNGTEYEPGVSQYMEVPQLSKQNLDAVQEFYDTLLSFR